ncbi:ABC transporter permease [Candidatus Latescibacterota bacterium]
MMTRLAVRTLGRNVRRTLLSVVGVGVGCAVALFLSALMRGSSQIRLRAIADSGFGHLRIAPQGWEQSRDNDLRLRDWEAELQAARGLEGVKVAAPHARAQGLLAFGTRVIGVEMLGVEPPAEEATNRLVRAIGEGRYLRPGDRGATVIGSVIAQRLDVAIDDELLLTAVRHGGQMQYAMLRIVGLVHTGSREIDGVICHVPLEDLEELTGLPGAAEITVTVSDPTRIDELAAALTGLVADGDEALTWREVLPEQGGDAKSDEAFMDLFVGIVIFVVVLGVTSAQLTAMLERRREFAVLLALGMRGGQVVRLVLLEAVALGIVGTAVGLGLATPLVYYTATTGIDIAALMDGQLSFSGVLFDPVFYSHMGWWMVPHAAAIAVTSALVAALYPAWYAVRTKPTSALSLREA